MKTFILLVLSLLAATAIASADVPTTASGIAIDSPWKQQVYAFAQKNVVHPSWGISHSERDYHVTLQLAKLSNFSVDEDVLFATAFLHDVGGLPPYFKKEVDHAERSVQVIEPLLPSWGFPMAKWPQVKEMILGHTYYGSQPASKPAQAFHDADVLDFLGAIGIARMIAITEEEDQMKGTLKRPVGALQSFAGTMAGKCILDSCKDLAKPRQAELEAFLGALKTQTFSFQAL